MNRRSRRENLSKRETKLLAFLFEHRGEVVTIEQIADLLWPDPDKLPDTYQSLVYNMISHLRANGVPVENVTGYRL